MKKFVVYYYQRTKNGLKEKTMEVQALSRFRARIMAQDLLPRHSYIGNVYRKNGENHKLVLAGLL